jgi:hypothetical protein
MRSGEVEIANLTQGEGGLSIRSSAPSTRLVLTQPVSLPAGDYRLLLKVQDDAHAASGRLRFSFACDSSLAFPSSSGGDPLAGGQVIRVNECKRQQLGLWLSSGSAPVSLNSLKIERIK